MADIFKLFEGEGVGAGGVQGQDSNSFSDIESENDLIARLSSGSDSVELLVDYSDFSNFVTFNSAESYVTVTADQILNEYPFGGTIDDLQSFMDSLDGFQRYFLRLWPSRVGHLRFNPAHSRSLIRVDDFGLEDGVSRTSFLSPGTGSFSIQGWVDVPTLTGSNDVAVIIDKRKSNGDGFAAYISGSSVCFSVVSGAVENTVSAALSQMPSFFSAVCERSTSGSGTLALYTATTGTFPTLAVSSSLGFTGRLDLGSGSFYIGSGSIPNKRTVWFTGSIDDISVWSTPRGLTQLTSSFNRKVHSQPGLIACWRFNEATPDTQNSYGSITRDCSGHMLDGRVVDYFPQIRGSGSFAYDSPDPILSLDDPDVVDYILEAQESGSKYDRDNETLIWKLFPQAFTQHDPQSAEIFKNFALIIARSFDSAKLYIDQLVNLRKVKYGEYDQAPDVLLEEVGSYFGWNLQGSFIDIDALRYFISRDVKAGPAGNAGLDTRLSDIKSQFWRRSLLNLIYIYKTKGTRESVESLLRTYGVDNGFVRLKEYARRSETRLPVERVVSEKSVWTLTFGSGSNGTRVMSADSEPLFRVGNGDQFTVEIRARFPESTNDDLQPTKTSGSIITMLSGSSTSGTLSLWYEKPQTTSTTGNLYLTSSAGVLVFPSASIFDDRFYNISVVRETSTGSIGIRVKLYEDGSLIYSSSSLHTSGLPVSTVYDTVCVGAWAGSSSGEFWGQEVRVWDASLTEDELDAHARDFNSYGRQTFYDNSDLKVHWRLDDGAVTDSAGNFHVLSSTPTPVPGTGSDFLQSTNPFKKYLLDYAYIPSAEYGWNQKKIRTFSGSHVDPHEAYEDENILSLEFNMYDALNEDISHLLSSYDELNVAVGLPVNKFRADYEGLQQMRETYFKRLQGQLSLRTFVDMLDFFDTTFIKLVERLLPARAVFKGDEVVIESHMLERPKYQYGIRPIQEGTLEISGSISVVDRDEEWM